MMFSVNLLRQLEILEPGLKNLLWMILEEIERHREDSVTKTEFNELKEIVRDISHAVKDLTLAQARTEQRLEELTLAQTRTEQRLEELTLAQTRTEQRLEELTLAQTALAQAQARTEQRLEELTLAQTALAQAQARTEQEIAKLSHGLNTTRSQVGGLSKSVSYALENEAFRKLPAYLKTHHQLEITERFVRRFIGGEEINLFAKATRQGQEVLIVGETVLKLDDRSKLRKLANHVNGVQQVFSQPIVPLLITHVVHPAILDLAQARGIVVVQSFEWD